MGKEEFLSSLKLFIIGFKIKSGGQKWRIIPSGDRIFREIGGKERKRKSSVMSHGRRREIIPSLHKCIGYVGVRERGSSTLSCPLKYGGTTSVLRRIRGGGGLLTYCVGTA